MTKITAEEHDARLAGRRNAAALERLNEVLANELQVPAPVTEIPQPRCGTPTKLTLEAIELARQVYYLSGGSMRDCARVILAAGVLPDVPTSEHYDQDAVTVISGRLQSWWRARGWPKRPTKVVFMIRDAQHDGGLYRAVTKCAGRTTGSGPAPKGKACTASPLKDSEFCWQHDPREKYAKMRSRHGAHLREARNRDMVPLGPLQDWLKCEVKCLLVEARQRGEHVNPKQQGWTLLANKLGINHALLCRIAKGRGTNTSWQGVPSGKGQIRASTVVKYLTHSGTTFRELYGYDPPERYAPKPTCPTCGGRMTHESKHCRTCHEANGMAPCTFVKVTTGETCGRMTADPSGMCHHCRRTTAAQEERRRNPQPKRYRGSHLTGPQLILATEAYLEHQSWTLVAGCMWSVNAAGIRDTYKSECAVASALADYAKKQRLSQRFTRLQARIPREEAVRRVREAHERLVAEHGQVLWPDTEVELSVSVAAMIPFEPYRAWLEACAIQFRQPNGKRGGLGQLARRLHHNPDQISVWIRAGHGEGKEVGKTLVRRAVVERSLKYWNEAAAVEGFTSYTFADLYGGGQ